MKQNASTLRVAHALSNRRIGSHGSPQNRCLRGGVIASGGQADSSPRLDPAARRPKSEGRGPKSERVPKLEAPKAEGSSAPHAAEPATSEFRARSPDPRRAGSSFGPRISFGLRPSGFGIRRSRHFQSHPIAPALPLLLSQSKPNVAAGVQFGGQIGSAS